MSGEAYGHYTNVGLFGGPPRAVGPAPRVDLPATGSDRPLTAGEGDGASATYGPATVFGGKQPSGLAAPPRSGPVSVSTIGTAGRGGSVTSSASIVLFPTPIAVTCDGDPPESRRCGAPGGFGGPVPAEGEELHSTCTANEKGVTGSTRFVNAVLSTSTDMDGEPKGQEPIPDDPPVNYTRETTIDNVGGHPKLIFNEQIVDPDGSITVNAVHMFLRGPIALGEQILGHVRCSMRPATASATTAPPASASQTPDAPSEASRPAPVADPKPGSGPLALPVALATLAGGGVLAVVLHRTRRRRAGAVEGLRD